VSRDATQQDWRWRDQAVLTPEETASILRVSRTSVYALLREGRLRHIAIGKLKRIPPAAVDEFLNGGSNVQG
jgi:excisionase family DNA binding protein